MPIGTRTSAILPVIMCAVASVRSMQVSAFAMDTCTQRRANRRPLDRRRAPFAVSFGTTAPNKRPQPGALASSICLGLAADDDDDAISGSDTGTDKVPKQKVKDDETNSKSESVGPAGAGPQQKGYVTKISKTEMTDLIERLGLQAADKPSERAARGTTRKAAAAGEMRGGTNTLVKSSVVEQQQVSTTRELSMLSTLVKNGKKVVAAETTRKLVEILTRQTKDEEEEEDVLVEPAKKESVSTVMIKSGGLLDRVTDISLPTQLDYARNGHAALRSILSPAIIQELRADLVAHSSNMTLDAYKQKVEVASGSADAASKCKTVQDCINALNKLDVPADALPFLQHFNVWRSVRTARNVAKSVLLSHAAATLLDVPSVKLYQDSIFHKRPGDGPTPWHSDARMAPFDTSKMVTFWIPLQPVPIPEDGGTGLLFVSSSHCDFALPYWNGVDGDEYDRLEERYGSLSHHMPLEVGDCTVHAGWTLHCADDAVDERYAYAVTYVDARAEIREDVAVATSTDIAEEGAALGDDEDRWSYKDWVKEVTPRRIFRHPSVPLVWPKMLLPKDLAKDKNAVKSLQDLRAGNDTQVAMDALESAGKADAATLTTTGVKDKEKKRSRQINQDRAVIVLPLSIDSAPPGSPFEGTKRFLGLFDGHNQFGEVVSEFVTNELPPILTEKMNDVQRRSSDLSERQIVEAIMSEVADAFVTVDSHGRAELDPPSGGCTATAVLQLGRYVFVANAGDSVSFVATRSKSSGIIDIVYETRKDKPDREDERKRIEECGGKLMTDGGTPRVVGIDEATGTMYGGIATSRSIGDWELSELGIIPEPHVDVIDMKAIIAESGGDVQPFAVCASDGVTDVMRVEDVAARVAEGLFNEDNMGGPHLLTSLENVLLEAKDGWANATQEAYRDDMTIAAASLLLL